MAYRAVRFFEQLKMRLNIFIRHIAVISLLYPGFFVPAQVWQLMVYSHLGGCSFYIFNHIFFAKQFNDALNETARH